MKAGQRVRIKSVPTPELAAKALNVEQFERLKPNAFNSIDYILLHVAV